MNIYKLKYTNKETAKADLIAKEVIHEDLSYQVGTHAVEPNNPKHLFL